MTNTPARVDKGVPAGGEFTSIARSEASDVSIGSSSPANILTDAASTERNPLNIPWPETPKNTYVEVGVSGEDVRAVLDSAGMDGDVVDGYVDFFAGVNLVENRTADFYGVKADGGSESIGMGIHDYERAVDTDDHENLSYPEGYINPMPAYEAEKKAAESARLTAAQVLLEDAGISLDSDEPGRGDFMITGGPARLQVRVRDFGAGDIHETRNWHRASYDQIEEALGGQMGPDSIHMFNHACTLVARDKRFQWYKDQHAAKIARDEAAAARRIVDGFSIEDVETVLQDEQHERACNCLLKEGACVDLGENWRQKTNIANVDAVFDALATLRETRDDSPST